MKPSKLLVVLLLAFLFSLGSFPKIEVKSETKTVVVPDDYPTIQEAIKNAYEGDTIFVKKGTYDGPINETLRINKTVSLICEENTELNLHPRLLNVTLLYGSYLTYDTAISIESDNVTFSGFKINVPVPGADISITGKRTQIIKCIIPSIVWLSGSDSTVSETVLKDDLNVRAPNQTITHCSITGYVEIFSSYNELTGNAIDNEIRFEGSHCTFYGNSFYRILMENSNSNEIHNNTCSGISLGIYCKDCSNNTVSGNLLNGGHIWGILMGCGSGNIFYGNHITNFGGTYSGYGVAIGGNYVVAENNTFYHNTFLNNNKNVGYNWELEGSGNFWDNGIEGNYWDDYTGTDTNGDGIGDTPYIIDENNQDNFPLMEPAEMSTIPEFQSWIFLVGGLFVVSVLLIGYKRGIKR